MFPWMLTDGTRTHPHALIHTHTHIHTHLVEAALRRYGVETPFVKAVYTR